MDHYNTYSKSSNSPSFTPINNERSITATTYGDGYVYTGPLSGQHSEVQSKSSNDSSKQTTPPDEGQNLNLSLHSIANLSLSTSPSTEVVNSNTTNQYQFKVMLLGDSGVGKVKLFIK